MNVLHNFFGRKVLVIGLILREESKRNRRFLLRKFPKETVGFL